MRPILLRIAESYPQALWHSFNFVNAETKHQNQKLSQMLVPSKLTQRIFSEIEKISMPDIRVKTLIDDLKTAANPQKTWESFQETNFSSDPTNAERLILTNDIKKKIMKIVSLIESKKTDVNKQVGDLIQEIEKRMKNVTLLSDLSPFLATFLQDSHQENVLIPGQHGNSFQKPVRLFVTFDSNSSLNFEMGTIPINKYFILGSQCFLEYCCFWTKRNGIQIQTKTNQNENHRG